MTVDRVQRHTRNIHCEGFERSDGLWDIEAMLTDTKNDIFINHERGEVESGVPIHKMKLCVTLDIEMVIQDIAVEMPYTPFQLCKTASEKMHNLIGLQIGAGWMKQARLRVERTDSCTHVMELLGPISTTAYQTMHHAIEEKENAKSQRDDPPILDQCKSLARDSSIVAVMWPEFYTGKSNPTKTPLRHKFAQATNSQQP